MMLQTGLIRNVSIGALRQNVSVEQKDLHPYLTRFPECIYFQWIKPNRARRRQKS